MMSEHSSLLGSIVIGIPSVWGFHSYWVLVANSFGSNSVGVRRDWNIWISYPGFPYMFILAGCCFDIVQSCESSSRGVVLSLFKCKDLVAKKKSIYLIWLVFKIRTTPSVGAFQHTSKYFASALGRFWCCETEIGSEREVAREAQMSIEVN